jgi:iron uptake system component EfeO
MADRGVPLDPVFKVDFNSSVKYVRRPDRRHGRRGGSVIGADGRLPGHSVPRLAVDLARSIALVASLGGSLAACTGKSDTQFQVEIASQMHQSIAVDLENMVRAAHDVQGAAPSHAWADSDPRTIEDMREAWKRMRAAWENIEGAMSPMFPGLNITLDARYEDFLLGLKDGDPNPFDAKGVVGMHAVERILFAATTRPEVVNREILLHGYRPAAYPATDDEAIAFKTQLAQRLVDDATTMKTDWRPDDVDISAAYLGLVDLMLEQQGKMDSAVRSEDESRYANVTLLDMRNNILGTQKSYELFREWILSKASAESSDQQILTRLDKLMQTYEEYRPTSGDSLPTAPEGWDSHNPSPESLNTPFGQLWQKVRESVDPETHGSVVYEMNQIAALLGFPALAE